LCEDPAFTACYELVKKRVARLRKRDPRVNEWLEHRPGGEMQADFGELVRLQYQGRLVRAWGYVAVWPYSRFRYAEVVLDQSIPTFLCAIQNGMFAANAIAERISVDNLAAAVLREHFHERGYQREFSAFCKHFGTLPNAVRPRTPTSKTDQEGAGDAVAVPFGADEGTCPDGRYARGSTSRGTMGQSFATSIGTGTLARTSHPLRSRRSYANGLRRLVSMASSLAIRCADLRRRRPAQGEPRRQSCGTAAGERPCCASLHSTRVALDRQSRY
jgi:hypothetical protein